MQIVIDIPDGRYNEIMTDDIYLDVPIFKEDIIATIPKGHGAIVDVDTIDLNQDEFITQSDYYAAECAIENAPTIIEAESEVEK